MNKSAFSTICILFLLFILTSYKLNAQKDYNSLCKEAARYELNVSLDTAITKYSEAIILKPTHSEAYLGRARCYFGLKKYTEAGKDYETYISAVPNADLSVLFYQGLCYYRSGDTEKATATAENIIKSDPSKGVNFSGSKILGMYEFEKNGKIARGLLNEALLTYEEQKTITAKTLVNIKLSEAYQELDSAWSYTSGILKEEQNLRDSLLSNLFMIYPKLKTQPEIHESARKFMVQAIKVTTEKNYSDAIALWYKAVLISPCNPLAYYDMALLYEILKNNAAAITEMKKYIELSPNASDLRKAQDKIYEWDTDTSTNTTVITKTDTTTTASGLKYIILSNGKGVQAANGNTVKVNYTGYFTDGRKFDSSIDNGEPSSFVLGQGKAIKGFDEGVALMKPGEKVRLIIPYQLGYGDNAVGPIPAKSTLIFDVELLEVK